MRLEFAEQQRGSERRPVDAARGSCGIEARCLGSLVDDAVRVVRRLLSTLRQERRIKFWSRQENAGAKGRLGAELFENELLDRIVENSVTAANGGLARSAGKFRQPPTRPAGAVGQTDSGGERLVISGGEPAWYALITWKYQAEREVGVIR